MILCQRSCRASLAVLAVALVTHAAMAQTPTDDDPILRALVDECARSMTLELAGLEKPYFVQYSADERVLSQVSATCGALVASETRRQRSLIPEVRVGSYELDSTNFGGGGGEGFGGGRRGGGGGGGLGGTVSLPLDDDVLVIRQAVVARHRSHLQERGRDADAEARLPEGPWQRGASARLPAAAAGAGARAARRDRLRSRAVGGSSAPDLAAVRAAAGGAGLARRADGGDRQ
jgi:hypothetical protein